ncbi:unnamed protein product [Discosporangium mesarthrocarpum]
MGVPRTYSAWQCRYFVIGGAVAKPHVLQIYFSKQSYDRMVLAVFGRKQITERVKAYKLNHLFKTSSIRSKQYRATTGPLHFFTVRIPTTRLKQLNFASRDLPELQLLRAQISRYTSEA